MPEWSKGEHLRCSGYASWVRTPLQTFFFHVFNTCMWYEWDTRRFEKHKVVRYSKKKLKLILRVVKVKTSVLVPKQHQVSQLKSFANPSFKRRNGWSFRNSFRMHSSCPFQDDWRRRGTSVQRSLWARVCRSCRYG